MAELAAKLAAVCRQVVRRRPRGASTPAVVTPAVVREVLGKGAGDALPPAVRVAIARERRTTPAAQHACASPSPPSPCPASSDDPAQVPRCKQLPTAFEKPK